jgi:hypothetical protein
MCVHGAPALGSVRKSWDVSVTHLVHDGSLLLQRHGDGVLVAVAVQSDLMACVGDHAALFRESLERVAGDEPGGLDVVLFKHLEQSPDTDRSGEEAWELLNQLTRHFGTQASWIEEACGLGLEVHTARDVAGAILASVRA